MGTIARVVGAGVIGCVLLFGACSDPPSRGHEHSAAVKPTVISPQLARRLTVERYRELFAQRYWRDKDGTYVQFPPLAEENFVVEEEGDALVVTAAPLSGYQVQARVSKSGAWVELVTVGYSSH